MTINAPVQARIIHPDEIEDLVVRQRYTWVWSDRERVEPPTADQIWEAGKTAFERQSEEVTFMVALDSNGYKMIDFITGTVTGIQYESGVTGMLNITMNCKDPRWTKVHGFYDGRLGYRVSGVLSITPRR